MIHETILAARLHSETTGPNFLTDTAIYIVYALLNCIHMEYLLLYFELCLIVLIILLSYLNLKFNGWRQEFLST